MISNENYNALSRFRDAPCSYENPPSERLCMLQKLGLVRLLTCRWEEEVDGVEITYLKNIGVITELGRDALSEFERVCHKEAKDKRQKCFENKLSIASVLISVVIFILGLLVEHLSGFIGTLGRWIENLVH